VISLISYGLSPRTQIFVVLAGLVMLLVILNFVRKKQLREQYSLLWILSAVVLILSAVFIKFIERASHAVGIYYPPAFLFLIAILLLLVLQFHFSTVISSLREQNKVLTQDLAILASDVEALKAKQPGRET
jgi:hypothetical protein